MSIFLYVICMSSIYYLGFNCLNVFVVRWIVSIEWVKSFYIDDEG